MKSFISLVLYVLCSLFVGYVYGTPTLEIIAKIPLYVSALLSLRTVQPQSYLLPLILTVIVSLGFSISTPNTELNQYAECALIVIYLLSTELFTYKYFLLGGIAIGSAFEFADEFMKMNDLPLRLEDYQYTILWIAITTIAFIVKAYKQTKWN